MLIPFGLSGVQPPWRRIVAVLLAVLTSVTTVTVMHKCVVTDIIRVKATGTPVRKIAQAVHGTVIASGELVLPRRDTVEHVVFPPVRQPWISRIVEVGYRPRDRIATVTGAVGVRLPGAMSLVASVTQGVEMGVVPTAAVALRRSW